MLSFHAKFEQTDSGTDRQTEVKQYAPDLPIRRHKNDGEYGFPLFFYAFLNTSDLVKHTIH